MTTALPVEPAPEIPDPIELAELAASTQTDPSRHIAYFGTEAELIAREIAAVPRLDACTVVARHNGGLTGWLLGENDHEIGRIWWWGPVVAPWAEWDDVADALYAAGRRLLPGRLAQEELASDDRHALLAEFAARHGFVPEEASVALQWAPSPAEPDTRVRAFTRADGDGVAHLHDTIFPGTHTNGRQLVEAGRHPIRLVAEDEAGITGYIAVEIESDGKAYIDYVGVDERARGQGVGHALLHSVLAELNERDTPGAHLTVRESNAAARALYAGAGFEEAMLLRPYRKGFLLDD